MSAGISLRAFFRDANALAGDFECTGSFLRALAAFWVRGLGDGGLGAGGWVLGGWGLGG